MAVSRTDTSTLGRWWWSVDRWTLGALLALIAIGYVMMLAASPAVAQRIGAASRHMFLERQVFYSTLAVIVMVGCSLLTPRWVLRFAMLGALGALALTALTLVAGTEIKGARRWLSLPGMSLQPSEFLKPCLAVVCAWLMAEGKRSRRFPGLILAFILIGIVAVLLKQQPDIGMLAVIVAVFLAQVFVSGINLMWVVAGAGGVAGLAVLAFMLHGHVRSRVQRFLDPEAGDNFQIRMSLEAFGNGGLFGRGPGEGRVKDALPDAHADFVFPVAAEEFGLIACLIILAIFAFVVIRGLVRLMHERDIFVALAATGLLVQFGLQAFINMGSSLHLIPTKGMTLPFVSYGGSSSIALAIGMGFLLALTRRRSARAEESQPFAQPVPT
ncbi:putative peptidoglycan glycosyltransferase FtsW [Sediminicoccus rosea]|jgi:cell division protein FtsW|uniref:Probable peptidoglycan glycosyltransferase FtsW n=2 Tax=Sediminicoccus rosea TaxID=1225128 RepID=A0ABZ0PFA5_9PROT|nr:putative peptidoglycan glycosyltransferase FtsW [Sediminicoccus rosea]WPB84409.1 putative peptidoglycan glycosyltransferase FtsW [Sediminicoccus rosea]